MKGKLILFRSSQSGGYGIIRGESGQSFFVHKNDVVSGLPLVGAEAEFTPAPRLPGKRHPRAVDVAFIGTYTGN